MRKWIMVIGMVGTMAGTTTNVGNNNAYCPWDNNAEVTMTETHYENEGESGHTFDYEEDELTIDMSECTVLMSMDE